jgi:phage terminase large subunit-like protein
MIQIDQAISDKNLLGALSCFEDLSSWSPWLVLLRAAYGLPLSSGEQEIFREHMGRTSYDPPDGGWGEIAVIVGRQSGKTRIAASVAVFEALTAPKDVGETYALLIAQDHRAAQRALLSYVTEALEASELLRSSVAESLRESVTLKTGVRIAAYPCPPAAVRGLRARVVICDELAFYRSSEGYPTDLEMLRALRPTLATTGGKLVVISSPYGQAGALWDLHRRDYGRDDAKVLVWQATAPQMNPTLSPDYLERMAESDPEGYRAEVLGEFRAGTATLFDPDALDACVGDRPLELPPAERVSYAAFVDPSGGRRDAFTVAIGHRRDDDLVIDLVRAWEPPLNPSGVIAEISQLLRTYRIRSVTGDRYAGEFPRERFRAHQIAYSPSPRPKSDLYLSLHSAVNAGRPELPDDPALLRELRGLERRRGPSGRDRVDHRPGGRDDRANTVAGVVEVLLRRPEQREPRVYLIGRRSLRSF